MGTVAEACLVSGESTIDARSNPVFVAAFNEAYLNLSLGIGVDMNLSNCELGLSENIAFLRSLAQIRYSLIDPQRVSNIFLKLEATNVQEFEAKRFEYENVRAFLKVGVQFGFGIKLF